METTDKLQNHKEWLIKVTQSCETKEQLESCMTMIGQFIMRMTKNGLLQTELRKIESDLLEAYLEKEATIIIMS